MSQVNFISGFLIGLSVYLLYLLNKCYFEVKEGHLAVSTVFGKAIRQDEASNQLKTYPPGLHFKLPWKKAIEISVMEQMIDLSGEEGGTIAMASDGTMLRFDSKLRFTPVKEDLYNFLFSIEKPIEHVKGLFICLLRNEIANFDCQEAIQKPDEAEPMAFLTQAHVGSYAAIRQGRKRLNHKIQNFCRMKIGGWYGIRFDGVDLTDILPPDELATALNAVINAQSEAQKLYAQTEGESEQRIQAANKGVAIAKEKARAVEEEIATIAEILFDLQEKDILPLYIDRRRTEVFAESRTSFVKRDL
jgi:regulator of protease activity HflC (stomatin/prohibitin superfamily)